MKQIRPDIVFSKGGFVSVPVVLAAKHCHVPAIIHESDLTPGLANRIAVHGAKKVCCNFPETMKYLPDGKAVLTGSPIRQELFRGNASAARTLCHIPDAAKPVLLIVGGSSGSKVINDAVRTSLPELMEQFYVIHLCGKGNLDASLDDVKGYTQLEYASQELADIFALADLVISRAGANSICELLALHKPNILIPLSAAASRGDQILNANSFQKQGFSFVLEEENLSKDTLLDAVHSVYTNRDTYRAAMEASGQMDSIATIVDLIKKESL
jgi:UDP-N-acetylglucosamine--N-acetylmuramyl-(pentapeptide) pyrophosphoryl-undecaprenol N-acetylglucosamine transferase